MKHDSRGLTAPLASWLSQHCFVCILWQNGKNRKSLGCPRWPQQMCNQNPAPLYLHQCPAHVPRDRTSIASGFVLFLWFKGMPLERVFSLCNQNWVAWHKCQRPRDMRICQSGAHFGRELMWRKNTPGSEFKDHANLGHKGKGIFGSGLKDCSNMEQDCDLSGRW